MICVGEVPSASFRYVVDDGFTSSVILRGDRNTILAANEIEQSSSAASFSGRTSFTSLSTWRRNTELLTVDNQVCMPQTVYPKCSNQLKGFSAKPFHDTRNVEFKTTPGVLPTSGLVPGGQKKKYCSFWIRSGECNYIQQGCLYVHGMPGLETLRQIGFRETLSGG